MEVKALGFFDNNQKKKSGPPEYLRRTFGLDYDYDSPKPNQGKKMYCTMCRKIYNGGVRCYDCDNILVEWKGY